MRFLLLAFLIAFSACTNGSNNASPPETETIPFRVDGTLDLLRSDSLLLTLDIEIADNDSTRERGMMQRTGFPDRSGMLFVFDQEALQQFWMGNTPIALDLIFIDANNQITNFAKYAVPFSNDPLRSSAPVQYVLEVPAGWVDSNGIVEGDHIRWQRH